MRVAKVVSTKVPLHRVTYSAETVIGNSACTERISCIVATNEIDSIRNRVAKTGRISCSTERINVLLTPMDRNGD